MALPPSCLQGKERRLHSIIVDSLRHRRNLLAYLDPIHRESTRMSARPPKKESNLELAKLMDTFVRVKCIGGRELRGKLRGYDDLVNIVLEESEEFLRGAYRVARNTHRRLAHSLTRLLLDADRSERSGASH